MIIKDRHILNTYQRKRIKELQTDPNQEYGILIRTFNNSRYKVAIVVGGKNEDHSSIEIYDRETQKQYSKTIDKYIIGKWTIECGEDIIELEVR